MTDTSQVLHTPIYLQQTPRPPTSTLFPYTTLFRSHRAGGQRLPVRHLPGRDRQVLPDVRVHLGLDLAQRLLGDGRSEEHTSELQSHVNLVCRLLLEKKNRKTHKRYWLEPK